MKKFIQINKTVCINPDKVVFIEVVGEFVRFKDKDGIFWNKKFKDKDSALRYFSGFVDPNERL